MVNKNTKKPKKETTPKSKKETKVKKVTKSKKMSNNTNSENTNSRNNTNSDNNTNSGNNTNSENTTKIKKNNKPVENKPVQFNNKNIFNKLLYNSLKNKNISPPENINKNTIIKSEQNYNESFEDIYNFRKKFKKEDLDQINAIIYHDENNDGMLSCSIVYHYLKEQDKNKEIQLIFTKPGKFIQFDNMIRDKNVIILDISFKEEDLQKIIRLAKSVILIDDHEKLYNKNTLFNGKNHSACAYTWKFFYPNQLVPKIIQYVDNSDAKLFLKHLPLKYINLFNEAIGFRYIHNKSKSIQIKKKDGRLFEELWNIIHTDPNFLIMIGHYYDQVIENLKDQIAINAVKMKFQGYDVGVLNFDAPALAKKVGRQIISNFKKRNEHIDFAVCWSYQYVHRMYRVQIIDDHIQTKINMADMARKLGYIGGTPKKGEGHAHIGNFYWPKSDNKDIWDLFNKKYL
jgi:hypothetical protein